MTETNFQAWRDKFAEECGISPDKLYYELEGPDGNRRLNEVIESANAPRGDDGQTDGNEFMFVFTFDSSNLEITRRYRFKDPSDGQLETNNVRVWHTFNFSIREIFGNNVEDDEDWTFEVGCWKENELEESPIDGCDGRTEVSVSREEFGDDYRPVRAFRVAGLSTQRTKIRDFIHSDGSKWGLSPEHGLLLEGPPGTGKTEIVMEICREEFGAVPVEISGPEILSRWLGESERILRERFDQARSNPSNVLYIDEIDAIARSRRQSTQEYSAQIVAQLLVLLDGLDTKRAESPVKVIASTNRAKLIDEALRRPGRLGRTIPFDSLSGIEALAVLHHYLEQIYRNQSQSKNTSADFRSGTLSDELEKFVTSGDIEKLNRQDKVDDVQQFLADRPGAEIKQLVHHGTRKADEEAGSTSVLEPAHLFDGLPEESTTRTWYRRAM